ncbi:MULTISPECIES: DUF29 domain-containing protein [unclassified Endozoicomonas]|uniref:DUF29 domain-containing protein n=1 Tax=unclassified Endozoicomonas TaxID=2644528 RepID=UPI002148C829|nr:MULTISPECIES: DUF29 domain-containing protein [unclassified Endozoicomonas]
MTQQLYETDFYSWTQQQANLIRQGRLGELDLDNILEEIESMGRSEYRQLSHRLDVLLMHLLKWKFQPENRSTSWQGSIKEQRFRLKKFIEENPGLKPRLPEAAAEAYDAAKIRAFKETGLPETTFPTQCEWPFEQVINDEFWPD